MTSPNQTTKPKLTAILLAAGQGRRFDATGKRHKLLQILPSGLSVAQQAAFNLRQVVDHVIAVVNDELLAAQLAQSGCEIAMFHHAHLGMGASLAFGMRQLETNPTSNPTSIEMSSQIQGALIALADMPFIHIQTIQTLSAALLAGADIVQPHYQHSPQTELQAGHPVGFARRHFGALQLLEGDVGARSILLSNVVTKVPVNDAGILRDIDVPSDLPPF